MKDTRINHIDQILEENERRRSRLEGTPYDPIAGVGCWGDRVEVAGRLLPRLVLERFPDYQSLTPVEQDKARIQEDFEYWCARCVTIKDKLTGQNVPLVLNRPQRHLLGVMEEQRVAGRPVRVILLKARQWGGSTLVQMYMAWMQLVRHTGWNSLICGYLQVTSKNIKRMYNLLLRHYPRELLDGDELPCFAKLEGQPNVQQITSRDCLVLTASSRSEDAMRGYDIAMAHLSEVAFWKESPMHSPDDVVRGVCGSVALKPETVVVLESTANGVGDYFHDEWLRAESGRSDKASVFVPWYEVGIYQCAVDDPVALWEAMDEYERGLWEDGRTLEQINWYHAKRKEYRNHELMMAEYPSSTSEAFSTSGNHPFQREHLDKLSIGCTKLPMLVGDIQGAATSGPLSKENVHLVANPNGQLKVWEIPQVGRPVNVRYLVVVDVGGRSETSDYSVIAVWRDGDMSRPKEIVAQWRGHIYHDQLAIKSMQLALLYNNAVLVIECNTLINEAARAGESEYILQMLQRLYGKLYKRDGKRLGFHTNVKTKREAITELVRAVRDGEYVERDIEAVNEMRDYQERNGSYAARPGKHDDILMTRAIGLLVLQDARLKGGLHARPEDFLPPDKVEPQPGSVPFVDYCHEPPSGGCFGDGSSV